jgi:acyl carrier protein
MSFEEEFEIEIDDEIAGGMATVEDALAYIVSASKAED